MSKKIAPEDNSLPNFKIYYKTIVIKSAQKWHKSRHIDEWSKTQTPEINTYPEINICIYYQLMFDRGTMNTLWRKDNFFKNCIEKTGYSHAEK